MIIIVQTNNCIIIVKKPIAYSHRLKVETAINYSILENFQIGVEIKLEKLHKVLNKYLGGTFGFFEKNNTPT